MKKTVYLFGFVLLMTAGVSACTSTEEREVEGERIEGEAGEYEEGVEETTDELEERAE